MLSFTDYDLCCTNSRSSFRREMTGDDARESGTLSYLSPGSSTPLTCSSLKKLITDSLSFFVCFVLKWMRFDRSFFDGF